MAGELAGQRAGAHSAVTWGELLSSARLLGEELLLGRWAQTPRGEEGLRAARGCCHGW